MIQVLVSETQQAQNVLNSWDTSRLEKYVSKEHPEIISELRSLMSEYKSYLFLCAMVKMPLAVPSENVDKIWHCHLCLNADYNQLTKKLTGRILPHQPFLDGDTPDLESKQNLVDASFKYFGKFVFNPEFLSHAGCNNCDGNGCLTCHNGCK